MINELFLQEFKAFSRERIELRPLTVLVGENNSGKSSVMAAIRLMAQTVQSTDPSIPILLDGPFGEYGSYRDIVHGNHRGRPFRLGLTVPFLPMGASPRRIKADRPPVTFEVEFKYRTQRRETIVREAKYWYGDKQVLGVSRTSDLERNYISYLGGRSFAATARSEASRSLSMQNFLPTVFPTYSGPNELAEAVRESNQTVRRCQTSVRRALQSVDVLGAMRQPPQRTYLHSGSVGNRVGVAGENWGPLVAIAESERSRAGYMSRVRRWLKSAGVAAQVDLKWLSDRHFEIIVTNPSSGETQNLSDVGRGTSQVLPVLIGGYRLASGQTYLVEEPEIHLHPRAQAALGDYFLDLCNRGVQSIVETHSEYLIMRIQQHVAAGKIDPKDVVFYYVSSSRDGKSIKPIFLDENAVFENVIPGGFFPQRREEAARLVRARSSEVS